MRVKLDNPGYQELPVGYREACLHGWLRIFKLNAKDLGCILVEKASILGNLFNKTGLFDQSLDGKTKELPCGTKFLIILQPYDAGSRCSGTVPL